MHQAPQKRNTDYIRGSNWILSGRYLQTYRIRNVQNAKGTFGPKPANHCAKLSYVVSIAGGNHTIRLPSFRKQKKRKYVDCAPLNSYRNVIGIEYQLFFKRKRWGIPTSFACSVGCLQPDQTNTTSKVCRLPPIPYICQPRLNFS